MTRLSLTIPDDLADTMRSELPDVCISKVLQQALRSMLECRHDVMSCQRCAALIERDVLADSELSRFYRDALWELRDLVDPERLGRGDGRDLEEGRQVPRDLGRRHDAAPPTDAVHAAVASPPRC